MLTDMQSTLEIAEDTANNDPDIGLRAVAALRALTERLEILQVDNARKLGWSWQDIATRLGVTKQTVHRKHGHRIGRRCPNSSLATPGRLLFARPSRHAASGTASSAASTCCTALPPPTARSVRCCASGASHLSASRRSSSA